MLLESAIQSKATSHPSVQHVVNSPNKCSVNSASVYLKPPPTAQAMSSGDSAVGNDFTPTPNQPPRK